LREENEKLKKLEELRAANVEQQARDEVYSGVYFNVDRNLTCYDQIEKLKEWEQRLKVREEEFERQSGLYQMQLVETYTKKAQEQFDEQKKILAQQIEQNIKAEYDKILDEERLLMKYVYYC
jgi:hypothetical protein